MFDFKDPEEVFSQHNPEPPGRPATYDENGAVLTRKRRLERDSRRRLEQLDFDPCEALVRKFMELQNERQYLEQRRSGAVLELNNKTGKPIYVKNEDVLAVDNAQVSVAKELMRFAYGRVTEVVASDEDEDVPMLPIIFTDETN
jgi:hypothetical protein